ncbi:MAG: hypothetical protein LBU24_02385 [Methanocalculaceae archaeon]|nr:hypothetical protein [Methanocalculaceae archaeon]
MTVLTDAKLSLLADDLDNRCGDANAELARLIHGLDPDDSMQRRPTGTRSVKCPMRTSI